MAAFTAIAAGVAAVGAIGGAIGQYSEARKSRRAAKKQFRYEQQLANNRAAKERIDAIRQARLARGALAQTAANAGIAGESSIALGALGSIQSQLTSNLSFLDTNQKLANLAGYYGNKATIHAQKAQTWGGVSDLGMSVFATTGGVGAFGGSNKNG